MAVGGAYWPKNTYPMGPKRSRVANLGTQFGSSNHKVNRRGEGCAKPRNASSAGPVVMAILGDLCLRTVLLQNGRMAVILLNDQRHDVTNVKKTVYKLRHCEHR